MGQPAIPTNLAVEQLAKLSLEARAGDDGMEPEVTLLVDGEPLKDETDDQG